MWLKSKIGRSLPDMVLLAGQVGQSNYAATMLLLSLTSSRFTPSMGLLVEGEKSNNLVSRVCGRNEAIVVVLSLSSSGSLL